MAKINFKQALKTLQETVPLLTSIVFSVTISVIVVGVLLEQVTNGQIPVVSGIATFLTNWTADVVAFFTTFSTAITVTLGLLVIVILVVLFRYFLGGSGKKGDKM